MYTGIPFILNYPKNKNTTTRQHHPSENGFNKTQVIPGYDKNDPRLKDNKALLEDYTKAKREGRSEDAKAIMQQMKNNK